MIDVIVYEPDGRERIISCDKESVMIGRAQGNDICLDVLGISRYHARLNVEGGQVIVQDLNSTNGTLVNSRPVKEAVLEVGDRITIGSVVLSVALRFGGGQEVAAERSGTLVGVDRESLVGNKATAVSKTSHSKPTVSDGSLGLLRPSGSIDVSASSSLRNDTEAPKPPSPGTVAKMKSGGEDAFYWKSLESFLGPIWTYVVSDEVSEILVNGPTEIYIETKGHLERAPVSFTSEQLQAAVLNIAQYVGRRVSEEEPYLDARLPDGSRVAVLFPPCSRKGISVSIRKFSKERLTLDRLMGFGSISKEMITFLSACVILKKNIIVSGGTSSGKTSLLNVVSGLIPADERILTIEDSAELQLSQEHVVPMETKPPDKKGRGQVTIRDLVRASLRMRPDRIVVGEIRSGEALDLLQAMNTGHSGSMATVHASSPSQALTRLETLALFSGIEIPMRALREQVSTAIDIVIQAARLPDHSRKVTHISEVGRLNDHGAYQVCDVFRFNNEGRTVEGKIRGRHVWSGHIPSSLGEMELAGLDDAVRLFKGEMKSVAEERA